MQVKRVKNLLIILLTLTSFLSYAQQNTISPYSVFGIGELQSQGFSLNNSMGGIGVAMRPNLFLNPMNSASLSALKLTTYEVGIATTSMFLRENNLKQEYFSATLSYLSLGFPISKGFAISGGLIPYSFQGYELQQSLVMEVEDTLNYMLKYSGSGGIHRAYINLGVEAFKGFSLGITASSFFGRISKQRDLIFDQPHYLNRRDEGAYSVGDLVLDFGTQYEVKKDNKKIIFGAKYQPKSELKLNSENIVYTYNIVGDFEYIRDTVNTFFSSSNGLVLPKCYAAGLSFSEYKHWFFSVEYDFKEWSELQIFSQILPQLRNATQYKLGFWWVPDYKNIHNYFSKIQYRAGVNYNTGFLSVFSIGEEENTKEIKEISFSFGLGLPLRKSKTTLNIGLQLGRRGSYDFGLVEEKYIKLLLTLTFNDKWFTKRKID